MATLVIKLVHRIGRHVTALNIAKTQVSGSILMADFVNAGYFAVRPDESGVVSPCSHVVDVAPLTYWLSDWEAEATTFGVEEDLLQDAKGWFTKNRSETLLLRFCDRAPAMVIGMSIHRDIVSLMLNDFEGQRPEGSSAYELLRLGKPPAPPTAVLGFDLLDVAPDIDHTWNCYRRFYEMIPPLSITKVSNDLLDPEADVQAVLDFIQAHEDDDSPNRFWTPWLITQY